MEDKIIQAYKEMVITGEENINSYTISKSIDISEKDFFEHFSSSEDIGRKIWGNMAEEVIEKLNGSEEFGQYSAREKVLAYYFTYFEVAVEHRTFIEKTACKTTLQRSYRDNFKEFIGDIVQEGVAMDEIVERLSLSNYYPDMLWALHLRLLHYWLNDSSEHFVDTERAIEIYTKVPLQLMGHNLFDSVFETAKFQLESLKPEKMNVDAFNIFRR